MERGATYHDISLGQVTDWLVLAPVALRRGSLNANREAHRERRSFMGSLPVDFSHLLPLVKSSKCDADIIMARGDQVGVHVKFPLIDVTGRGGRNRRRVLATCKFSETQFFRQTIRPSRLRTGRSALSGAMPRVWVDVFTILLRTTMTQSSAIRCFSC